MPNSKIFVTMPAVDFAMVLSDGNVITESVQPIMSIEGKVDDVEDVVVDFGTIKQELKNFKFFDHKLVIPADWETRFFSKEDRTRVSTANFVFHLPSSGVYQARIENLRQTPETIASLLSSYLETSHVAHYIQDMFNVELAVIGSATPELNINVAKSKYLVSYKDIRYAHLLPFSTSEGCQTIHGHRSQCILDTSKAESSLATEECPMFQPARVPLLIGMSHADAGTNRDGNREYVITTKDRGVVNIVVRDMDHYGNPVMELPRPPTQETIFEYLTGKGIPVLYLTEGLGKGVITTQEIV